jgi:meso-butanediol dehydrogenase/(S,S)-butanediol dehydrogenase/diacetyl reductase
MRRVAIVTGAGGEIGEASALRFAEAGWSVACVDSREEGVRQTAQRAESSTGQAIAVAADVSSAEGSRRMVDDAVQAFGRVDALHLNAPPRITPAAEEPALADWDGLHAVMVRGAYLGIRQVIPELRRSGGGAIVLTAGAAGIVVDPHLATMNGALRSLCRSVATGYGKDSIRINTICPGMLATRTEIGAEASGPEAALTEIAGRLPLRRLASARDLANVALFLASPEASYVTGTDVVMDGGLLALVS